MVNLINDILMSEKVKVKTLMQLSGKIEFYKDTVSPRSRWERGFILQAIARGDNKDSLVDCDSCLVSQCKYWLRAIMASTVHSPIPDPYTWQEHNCLHYYPDASGGASMDIGGGVRA